jgi:CRP-like cAMP-binding protein
MSGDLLTRIGARAFFAVLTPAQREILIAMAAPATFDAGARIFNAGDPAEHFWLLDTGTVTVSMLVPGRGDVAVETLSAGTVLGWSWLYPPYRWTFGAQALESTTAVAFDAAAVRSRCAADTQFGYAMLSCFIPVIIDRLQNTRLRLLDLYGSPPGPDQGGLRP